MSHEVESMAWTNELPWHRLGAEIKGLATIEEWMTKARIDWSVEMQNLYLPDGTKAGNHGALVRTKDKKILTFASMDWKPWQNRDAMEFLREYCEVGGATLETVGSLRGGRQVWGLIKLDNDFTLKGGDKVKGYLLIVCSHEIGKAHLLRTTAVRVVCANTMAMALAGASAASYKQNHREAFDVSAAKQEIALSNQQMDRVRKEAEALTKLTLSDADAALFLSQYFRPLRASKSDSDSVATMLYKAELAEKTQQSAASMLEKAEREERNEKLVARMLDPEFQTKEFGAVMSAYHKAPGAAPGTGWGVLNAVTYYSDHMAGYNPDTRMTRSWLGDRARVKEQVNKQLLEMAQ